MYANGIKFGYYRKEAEHQKVLFRKEYRDAANQLGKRMDQLFGREDGSAKRCSPSITNRNPETNQQAGSSSNCSAVANSVSSKQNDSTEKPTTVPTCNSTKKGCHVEDDYYEIDKILNVRFLSGKMKLCLVRWKGCTDDDDSWEPASDLTDTACKSLFI